MKPQKRIVLDIENTTEDNYRQKTIWICVTKDIDTGEIIVWDKATEQFKKYLESADLIIGHNVIQHDGFLLNRLWNTKIRLNQLFDTLVVSRLLNPNREGGHSLESWSENLTKITNGRINLPKIEYAKVWCWMQDRPEEYALECYNNPVMPLLTSYCIRDVEATEQVYYAVLDEIKKYGFSDYSVKLEHEVQAIISEQSRNGFVLNVPFAMSLLSDVKNQMAAIQEEMQKKFPPIVEERYSEKTGKRLKDKVTEFNPGSRQQIAERLMSLGWKPTKKTEKGSIIVDESVLEGIDIPEAKIISRYLMLGKRAAQVESWVDAVADDGRVHGSVITNGAVTGRMTHSSPNMAQVPSVGSEYGHECRACWTVPDGYVQVGVDASGLELRMLAHYMNDPSYTKTVCEGNQEDGTDIHTVNQKAAGLPTRNNAKTFIYGWMYGAGPAKIGSIVGGTAKEGQKLIDQFLKSLPSLGKLRKKVDKYAAKGYVPGLDGRIIWVRSEHAALNSLLQGAGAIVMKQSLVIFYKKIVKNKWPVKLVANVHDEFQMEVKKGYEDVVGQAAVESIREAGVYFNMRCPLDGEYKVGANWAETH